MLTSVGSDVDIMHKLHGHRLEEKSRLACSFTVCWLGVSMCISTWFCVHPLMEVGFWIW